MSSRRRLLPGEHRAASGGSDDRQLPSELLASGEALSPAERSLLEALRRPGRRTVHVDTTDDGVRGLQVEEVIPVQGCADGVLTLVRRLLMEAPFQDVTLRQADGRIVSLRRVLHARFSI